MDGRVAMAEPRRALVLTSTFPRFSGDTMPPFVLRLCQAMKAEGWESFVLAPHARGLASRGTVEGIPCARFRYAPSVLEQLAYGGGMLANVKLVRWRWLLVPLYILSLLFYAGWYVQKNGVSVVHAHWIIPQGFAGAILKRVMWWKTIRLVITVHGSDLSAETKGLIRKITRWSARQADVVTVVSNAIRRDAVALGISPDKIVVGPMGVDTEAFSSPDELVVRKGILFVGRLVPEKGVEHLLNAFALLAHKVPDIMLTIVGDGPLRGRLEAQVHLLNLSDKVIFAGAKLPSEIPFYLQTHQVFVLSSLREGLGLVVAEAMACKCPVVAHALPGVKDLVSHGETGLLVDVGDAGEMAAAIEQIMAEPMYSKMLVDNAYQYVNSRFGWKSVARNYADVYAGSAANR